MGMPEKRGELLAKNIQLKSVLPQLKAKENTLWFMFLRAVVNTLLLTITLIYQIKDSSVIRPQDLLPIYSLIGFTYFITIAGTLLMPKIKDLTYFISSQIAYDVLFITALIYITGTQEAVFTFLYLFTIAFSSILYLKTGSLYTAAFSSICFSTLLILDPIENREKHLMTLFFNNVAFFLVALLSGYLSDQFKTFRMRLKEEEESVKELEDLNKIIIDNMTSGLLTTDLQNNIIYFNQAAEKITGLHFSTIYKKNIFDIFPDLKKHWIKKAPSKKEVPVRKIFHFKNASTIELTLGFALSDLKDAYNQKCGNILIFEDLTKTIEMEQHVQRTDKLAAIGKLAAGIAHEIRNPLASVSGSIEMLSREIEVKDENKKLMNIILKETDRLNSLVNEFLDYVRPSEKKQTLFKINHIIEDTLMAFSMDKQASKHIEMKFTPENKNLEIKGDKEKIKQIFWNLFLNAAQAMPEGGKINIRSYAQDEQLYIDIEDTGEGIDEENIKKIFDPFFTTKPKGTGLGLSMVHKIIEAHQGRISVNSKVGKGTTFTLIFPLT
ncbi:MAG: hypothetical protein A2Z91_06990 [Deltaproteobacteria bacterium GWA2_38_16]|nr:MAG: hypothetical protein A2Z91_06990 [Deltaproteobacteria bacterium GWA2_38_16]OGQ02383.1 MAG: hypothetical protein A3D19_06035 [Deltaproteobacteria bacterium RIFCSPHIGHO2_02_FULL_38_15]OGQ33043.1 MAG: hypothetical protein A3A72_01305 [Deltaproteobacteria bacterium RIFCSPLOWO2_01_FULL_38_9]OGQ62345.1 MAG: hypothetical protein A3G92_06285 [Deltaproteobacteria bacterium RIFCSPLOWO2_12_FULL_38_8]HBQ20718.1 hypothetical protein [Deltaproteobacteria bacterium]